MALDIKTKLVMVATVPVIIGLTLTIFLAINDMTVQRDYVGEVAKAYLENTPRQKLSPEALQQEILTKWQELHVQQRNLAVPGIIFLAVIMVSTALFFVNRLTKGFTHLIAGVAKMTRPETSLSFRIATDNTAELTPIAERMNAMMDRMEQAMRQVSEMSKELHDSADNMKSDANSNQNNAEQLMANMESVTHVMGELKNASAEIASNVQNAHEEVLDVNKTGQGISQDIRQLDNQFNQLKQLTTASSNDVSELGNQVEGIYGILQTIQGIAEQTNLLALNAAIEAARAGEQGRGFAVVADEVRNLAGKTQQSTEEIKDMIEGLKEGADRSMKAMNESSTATDKLAESFNTANEQILALFQRLDTVNSMNTQIATASEEQSVLINNVSENTDVAKNLADHTKDSSGNTRERAEGLTRSSEALNSMISGFTFD